MTGRKAQKKKKKVSNGGEGHDVEAEPCEITACFRAEGGQRASFPNGSMGEDLGPHRGDLAPLQYLSWPAQGGIGTCRL